MKEKLKRIKRALISVYDKSSIIPFAKELQKFDIEIISTGGTAQTLKQEGINITEVSQITGFPEILNGRVKTLHPKIHAGLLAIRDKTSHLEQLETLGIGLIDLVVVNLYPFEKVIQNPDCTLAEAIENIDIGGPAMIRAAAKNYEEVTVVTSPAFYQLILEELRANNGSTTPQTRQLLATYAFALTSSYDKAITDFLLSKCFQSRKDLSSKNLHAILSELHKASEKISVNLPTDFADNATEIEKKTLNDSHETFPERLSLNLKKIQDLRYGENPHQAAALYSISSGGIAKGQLIQGKEMSFNNYLDSDTAWSIVCEFDEPACAIIKHTNPAGVGIGNDTLEAYERALSTDPVSAFGGIVAFNRIVDEKTANKILEIFTEVVVAPDYTENALAIFSKKKNLRILKVGHDTSINHQLSYRSISGGILIQEQDDKKIQRADLRVVTKKAPSEIQIKAMLFAWKVCKHVKSNAIVLANGYQTLGIGAGQMNRLDSIKIAAMRAKRFNLPLEMAVLASDAFFPFRDNVDEAASHGISAIIQPGGSIKDDEVIKAANEHNISMVFTGFRHFRH